MCQHASLPTHKYVETYRLGISKLGGNFQEQQRNGLLGNFVSPTLLGMHRTILAERLGHWQPGVEKSGRVGSVRDDVLGNTLFHPFHLYFLCEVCIRMVRDGSDTCGLCDPAQVIRHASVSPSVKGGEVTSWYC